MSAKVEEPLEDPNIVPRVKKYLEDNIDEKFLDMELMVKALRDKYPEYATRQQKKFRKSVEEAYRVVSISYGLDGQVSGNDDSDGSVELMDEQANSKNPLKNIMNNMYRNNKNKDVKNVSVKPASGAEAIDISSDEDDSNEAKPKNTTPDKSSNVGNTNTPGSNNLPRDKLVVTLTKIKASNGSNPAPLAATSTSSSNHNNNKRRDNPHPEGTAPKKYVSQQQLLEHLAHENIASAMRNFRNGMNGIGGGSQMGATQQQQMKPQPQKKFKKVVQLFQSHTTFQHLGGMEKKLKELCEILIHFKVPDIYFELGVVPPRGILLHGPSGCGKSMLASAIAGQLNLNMINVPATELIAGVSGESEERIRDIFEQARLAAPSVLFIDEIDAISGNRMQAQKDMERRVVSQLISSIDSLRQDMNGNEVLLIGATSRPDVLDPALRREGRFDYEIALTIPSRKERKEILRVICDGVRIDLKLDYDKIAELTPGYVPADLVALTARAASIAVKKKWWENMRKLRKERKITIVDLDDLDEATPNADANADKKKDKNANEDKSEKEKENEKEKTDDAAKEADVPKEAENSTEKTNAVNGEDKSTDETDEKMDVDTAESTEKTVTSINISDKENSEPTLAEMINWLDTPPEDFDLCDFSVTLEDFCAAIKVMQPSAKREGFVTVPDVTWDDIGSLRDIREELSLAILAPVKFPEKMARLGLEAPSGVLLCGPPGCGKTLIAKAIANEAGINFISVKGPELMNMYVGESERAVRDCFQRARNSAPCVIFFDEFDSLCPKRASSSENSSGVRIVNQLLTEMDGIQERKGVYIVAATNRPDIIDPAILRPGRLDTILYVGMPECDDRYEILCAATKNRTTPVLAEDVDLKELARLTENYSGADLAGLIRQAAMLALKDALNEQNVDDDKMCVKMENFMAALQLVRPSISEQDRIVYEALRKKYAAPRAEKAKEDDKSTEATFMPDSEEVN